MARALSGVIIASEWREGNKLVRDSCNRAKQLVGKGERLLTG